MHVTCFVFFEPALVNRKTLKMIKIVLFKSFKARTTAVESKNK